MDLTIRKKFQDIVFDPIPHTYTRKGDNYTSVTTLIHSYTQPFIAEDAAEKVFIKTGQPKDEILSLWQINKEYSCVLGTEFHLYVETFLRYGRRIETITGIEDRIEAFHKFWDTYSDMLEIVDLEILVYDEETKVAGTIDCLAKNKKNGKYVILDWKTNKEIKTSNQWQNMKFPFEFLQDCNFNHYSLQISTYTEILKKAFPNFEFENGRLIHFAKKSDSKIIRINDLSVEAKMVLNRNK